MGWLLNMYDNGDAATGEPAYSDDEVWGDVDDPHCGDCGDHGAHDCDTCGGGGTVKDGWFSRTTCPDCHGSGEVNCGCQVS